MIVENRRQSVTRTSRVIVWDILGVVLQIGGFFLTLSGSWIIVLQLAGGFVPAVNDVGPTALIAGIVAFATGASMDVVQNRRIEQSYLLPSSPETLPSKPVSPPRVPKKISCPSCGYENDDGGLFCLACNAAIWHGAKMPVGPPLSRSEVMARMGRVLMMRRLKRVSVFIILALAISIPLATNLALGHFAIDDSSFKISSLTFMGSNPRGIGDLYVGFKFDFPGNIGLRLTLDRPAYNVTLNNSTRYSFNCGELDFPCVGLPGVNGTILNGGVLMIRINGVAGLYEYNQQITRSVSLTCDSRCVSSGRTTFQ